MSRVVGAYAAAVRLYPRGFRREYERDLTDLAGELVRDLGPRRACLRLAGDLLASIPARYLEVVVSRPAPLLLPALAVAVAVGFGALAVLTGAATGAVLLALALVVLGWVALVLPQARTVREGGLPARWWQLLVLGLLLPLGVSAGQVLFDADSAFLSGLAVAATVTGGVLLLAGAVLGVVHATRRRPQASRTV